MASTSFSPPLDYSIHFLWHRLHHFCSYSAYLELSRFFFFYDLYLHCISDSIMFIVPILTWFIPNTVSVHWKLLFIMLPLFTKNNSLLWYFCIMLSSIKLWPTSLKPDWWDVAKCVAKSTISQIKATSTLGQHFDIKCILSNVNFFKCFFYCKMAQNVAYLHVTCCQGLSLHRFTLSHFHSQGQKRVRERAWSINYML